MLMLTALASRGAEAWWGLWNTGMELAERSLLYSGTNNMYVRLTAQNSPMLVGGQLHAVRFYVSDKTAVRSVRVWASTTLTGEAQLSQEVPLDAVRDVAHDLAPTVVSFSEPLSVLPATNPYASIYVGFTLELADTPITYMLAGKGRGAAYSNYYNGMDAAANYGALALQVLISGPGVPSNSVALSPFDEQTAVAAQTGLTTVAVINQGSEPLTRVGYVVTIDGQQQPERTVGLPQAVTEIGRQVDLPVEYDVPATAEEHQLAVAVTRVNDTPLTAGTLSQQAPLVVLDREAVKRTVMEEFTGTWCQNCIRGFVGIELLEQQFGDRFIAIAMHSDDPVLDRDPMTVSHYRNSTFYKDKSSKLGGLPSCTIDRWIDGDPYCGYNTSGPFETDQLVAEALARRAVADLRLTATWTDDSQTAVAYDVETSFRYSSADAHYSLILVLTADSLTGDGDRWRQINGYDDYTGTEAPLLPYVGRGHYLTDMVYNHVAVDIVGVNDGIAGSITSPLVADAPQHFHHELSTAGNALIQDRQHLNAVAMLIDTRDGSVVNAAKAPVTTATAVPAVSSYAATPLQPPLHDLTGRRLAQPARHGVYIVGGKKVLR